MQVGEKRQDEEEMDIHEFLRGEMPPGFLAFMDHWI
jgi:hypothetical protein